MSGTFDYLGDNLIELRGPVNAATNLPVSTGLSPTCILYDTRFDTTVSPYVTTLIEDAPLGIRDLFVQDPTAFDPLDFILVEQDDGTEHFARISSLVDTKMRINVPLSAPASTGNRVTMQRINLTNTHITVADWGPWEEGMVMSIFNPTGFPVLRTLTELNKDAGYSLMSSSPGQNLLTSAGIRVGKTIVDQFSMANFGTFPTSNPEAGDRTWGYRATIPHDAADLELGMRLRADITFTDGTLNAYPSGIATVINR